jgi:hypothetical protein
MVARIKDLVFDDWQQEILDYSGDILLCKGRRIGGTEIFSVKAVKTMVERPGVKIVMVSLTEDQAQLIIDVAHNYALLKYPKLIGKGRKKPTLNKLFLVNGSSMIVRPLGTTGNAIRSFDGDILGIDEATWQDKKIWRAARPIITTNDGNIWMWGSPGAKEGYFYEEFAKFQAGEDTRFRVWHKNSEDVLFNRPISRSWTEAQRAGVFRILKSEKESMTKLEYANEYLAQFVEDVSRFFSDEIISRVQCLSRVDSVTVSGKYFLGVDVARLGGDESSFEVLEFVNKKYYHRESVVRRYILTTATVDTVLDLDTKFSFTNIFVDDGGLGVAVVDPLLDDVRTRRKVVAINNSSRAVDFDDSRRRKLLKEDLYMNILRMMEHGDIFLLVDDNIRLSLASIMYEYDPKGYIKIYGRYSHIVEGLIRAAWANHSTRLELWAR